MRDLQEADFGGVPDSVRLDGHVDVQFAEGSQSQGERPVVAVVSATRTAFLAVLGCDSGLRLVGGVRKGGRRWDISDSPDSLAAIVESIQWRAEEGDPHLLAIARTAVDRWLSGRRARASTGAGMHPSRARRALLARLDAAAREAPSHTRAALAARTSRVRTMIGDAVNAGAEHALRELSAAPASDLDSLLASCESALVNAAARRNAPCEAPSALRALLLLRRAP